MRHTFSPEDNEETHFDFLLEDKDFCRTWRLSNIPILDGSYVDCLYIAPHNLYWLDIEQKVVSGNRGVATRIKNGFFYESLPSVVSKFINLSLKWDEIQVDLVIDQNGFRVLRKRL